MRHKKDMTTPIVYAVAIPLGVRERLKAQAKARGLSEGQYVQALVEADKETFQ